MLWVSYAVSPRGHRTSVIVKAIKARVRLFTSAYILNEVARTLIDDFGKSQRFANQSCQAILRVTRLIDLPEQVGEFVPADPGDNPIIQTALTAKADYLVTADKVLLDLGKVRDVAILTLDQFAARLPAAH